MQKDKKIVAGLDIGSTKVCVVVARRDEQDKNRIEILGVGKAPSEGVTRGVVINIDKTVEAITQAVKQASMMSNIAIELVNVGIATKESDKKLLALLNFITSSESLSTQITQIDKKGENISMYLLFSNAEIVFGDLNEWESKMKKLKIVYRHILPRKGWNTYEKITLKYHQQVVCEYAKR